MVKWFKLQDVARISWFFTIFERSSIICSLYVHNSTKWLENVSSQTFAFRSYRGDYDKNLFDDIVRLQLFPLVKYSVLGDRLEYIRNHNRVCRLCTYIYINIILKTIVFYDSVSFVLCYFECVSCIIILVSLVLLTDPVKIFLEFIVQELRNKF